MTEYTVQLLSYLFERCKFCGDEIHDNDDGDLSHAINHYIGHGMELLHAGNSSYGTANGVVHGTTAILGCDAKPPLIKD